MSAAARRVYDSRYPLIVGLLLLTAATVNFLSSRLSILHSRMISILNGLFLLSIALFCVASVAQYCRALVKPPMPQHFLWARLTFAEASQWKKSAANEKPHVDFTKHAIKTTAEPSQEPSQSIEPSPMEEGIVAIDVVIEVKEDQVEKSTIGCDGDLEAGAGYDYQCDSAIAQNEGDAETCLCCPCCLSDFDESSTIALLKCGHMFCEECIVSWAERATTCPFCRKSMLVS